MGQRNSSVNSFIIPPDFHASRSCSLKPRLPGREIPPLMDSAHDHMPRIFQNNLLGGGLGLAVKMQADWGHPFRRNSPSPVKNQIRGKENELVFRRQFREQLGDLDIHAPRRAGIRLRLGDGTDGGAMNDKLRSVLLELAADGVKIKQIQADRASGRVPASAERDCGAVRTR